MKVAKSGRVSRGVGCPGGISRDGQSVACDRVAVAVVESRGMYKCSYGHRWRRDFESEEKGSYP